MEPTIQPVYRRVYQNFANHVAKKDVVMNDAFDALRSLVYIVDGFGSLSGEENKSIVIQTLEDITAGRDGVLYTEDDLLPRHVLEGLKLLIETNMISATIDLICEATHAKIGFSITWYLCKFTSFLFCGCCKRRKKDQPLLQNIH